MSKKSKTTDKNYKNLPKDEKDDLIDNLFYDYSQNLKIPFFYFIQRKKQLFIGISILIVVYISQDPEEGKIALMIEFSKYYFGSMWGMYLLTHYKYEDIL